MIIDSKELLKHYVELWKSEQYNIICSNGVFDIVHIGHLKLLESCYNSSEDAKVIIGINSDKSTRQLKGDNRPINNEKERAEILDAFRFVNGVFIFDDIRANEFLNICQPNIYVKGGDYNLDSLNKEEYNVLIKCNAKIIFCDYYKGKSTTKILEKLNERS